jgi:hypothetical protein
MFDCICIGRQDPSGVPIDLGFLAEALVFYRRVHVTADPEMFKSLVRICGYDSLVEMLEMGVLTIDYAENTPTVVEHSAFTPYKVYDFGMIQTEQQKYQTLAPKLLEELTGKSGKARRQAQHLSKLVRVFSYDASLSVEALQDSFDEEYMRSTISALLRHFVPGYKIPEDFTFRLYKDVQGCRLETNMDFHAVTEALGEGGNSQLPLLTPSNLLSHVIATRKDLRPAAEHSADLAVSEPTSIAASGKFRQIIARTAGKQLDIQAFEELVFSESRCIREAVNGGHRTFDDVLRLVKAGAKFKEWLKKSSEDGDLVNEYCKEVTRAEWAEHLPPKAARWAIFAAASTVAGLVLTPVVGAAVGVGLSAGDTFLVDRLIKGWKPNQFVNGPLRQFVAR